MAPNAQGAEWPEDHSREKLYSTLLIIAKGQRLSDVEFDIARDIHV